MVEARRSLLVVLLAAGAASCGNKPSPPEREPPPRAAPSSSASAQGSANEAPARATIPKLKAEKLTPKEGKPGRMFAIEGALMTIDGARVGRVNGDDIEWVGEIPKSAGNIGENVITDVVGQWPDKVAAIYRSANARAPQPMYYPIGNKKAAGYRFGEGGVGTIHGTARVGETVFVSGFDYLSGHRLVPIAGPKLPRIMQAGPDAGCKNLSTARMPWGDDPALFPAVTGSTPAGTIVTIGTYCKTSAAAAEVWRDSPKSRIVPLDTSWKKAGYGASLAKGNGDELFAYGGKFLPVLRYHDGEFSPLPHLEAPIRAIFTSSSGVLHAVAAEYVYRYEGGKWAAVAMLPAREERPFVVMDEKGALWDYGAARLREDAQVPLPEPCAKPFVYMYAAAWINSYQKGYTYPSTRKALSSFPGVASITLVEFGEIDKHLGVRVQDRAQGEALIAHVKATMKDEDPKLLCHEPEAPRVIDMAAK